MFAFNVMFTTINQLLSRVHPNALLLLFMLYLLAYYTVDVRGQSNKGEDCDIISHTDDEDKPEPEGKVLDVLQADLLPRPVLLPLEDPLGSTVKHTQEYGTEQGEDAESKTCTISKRKKKIYKYTKQ